MRKYSVKVKMIKEVTMDHEQENRDKALNDVKTVVENATKDSLNQIFNSEPKFIYKIERV